MSTALEPECVLGNYLSLDRQHAHVDNQFTRNVVQQVLKHMNRLCEVVLQQVCLDPRDTDASYGLYGLNARHQKVQLDHKLELDFHSRRGQQDGLLQAENDGSGQLTLSMMSPYTIQRWIDANRKRNGNYGKRPIALPFFFSAMDSKEAGHMAMLFFDVASHMVYFVDPNGQSNFFDTDLQVMGVGDCQMCVLPAQYTSRSQFLVDAALQGYIDCLNQVSDIPWFFVSQTEWNTDSHAVNRSIATSHIGNGHCVVTSLAIAHYILLCGETPTNAVARFATLPDARLIALITSYNSYLNDLLELFDEPEVPASQALPRWMEDTLGNDEFDVSIFDESW